MNQRMNENSQQKRTQQDIRENWCSFPRDAEKNRFIEREGSSKKRYQSPTLKFMQMKLEH